MWYVKILQLNKLKFFFSLCTFLVVALFRFRSPSCVCVLIKMETVQRALSVTDSVVS